MTSNYFSIMCIDDDPGFQMFVQSHLGECYDVHYMGSAEEYLNARRKPLIDLIIMDDALPKMTGIELCEFIKDDPFTRHIPVLMFSSVENGDNRQRAYAAGCDDYLPKDISPNELLATVDVAMSDLCMVG